MGGVHGKGEVESTLLDGACRAMPVAMTDSAETEGSDGGGPVERDKKNSSTSTFENNARDDFGKPGEE
jgi:hypothetical protein